MGKFDEIFDDVVVNAKAAAAVVSKKASSVYDTSKHKISAAEIRGEINKKLRDLGAATYRVQVHGIDLNDEISALVAEITDLKEALAVVNEHIAAARNERKCPSCDAAVPRNSVFCNICGAKLDDEFEEETAEAVAEEDVEATEPTEDSAPTDTVEEPTETV